MNKVRIITERVASLSFDFASKNNITLIPANIITGDTTIKDDKDEIVENFLRSLDPDKEIPSTAAPSLGDIIKVFEDATVDADEAIYISASSKLSALYSIGVKAAKELESKGKKIAVFDSYATVSISGMYAYEASRLAAEGKSTEEIMTTLTNIQKNRLIDEYGVIETLKFLEKNGRIGKAKAWIAGIFSFKPLITERDGVLEPITKVRTNTQGLEYIVEQFKKTKVRTGATRMRVMYDYGISDEFVKSVVHPRMEKEFDITVISYNQISPTIACHLGPNVWGVCARFIKSQ